MFFIVVELVIIYENGLGHVSIMTGS